MQAMARALSDNYRPTLGADGQPSFDGPPDSRAGSNGGSLFGSLQSDCPAMNSPFNAVCPVTRPASTSLLWQGGFSDVDYVP